MLYQQGVIQPLPIQEAKPSQPSQPFLQGLKIQAFLDGGIPFLAELEDIIMAYVHHNVPKNIWDTLSPRKQ